MTSGSRLESPKGAVPLIGRTLSHYKILEKIGSGGMGDVYLAEDTDLARQIALKVLPPDLAESEERRARFQREAKAVAALNHPHIVTVYSVEEAEGVHFITMELVRGKTLSELIPRKGLSLAKFLEIAIPLADAVAAAHEKGILHRDLKPDNLMVSDEGRLKILDFGLAKLNPETSVIGVSEIPTKIRTEEGKIVGTVAYMSPEQAEGKALDARSDIFSLGIVLYEMATGERPFSGETPASVLSSIIKDTPPSVTAVNPSLPPALTKIVRRSLIKDPEHRYQTAKDVRNELEELKQEMDSGELSRASTPTKSGALRRWLVPAVAALLAVALGVYLARRPTGTPTLKTQLEQLTREAGIESFPSLSPAGDQLVYVSGASGNLDIYLQRVGGQKPINLTEDSPADNTQPAFSPDGKRIAFRSERDGGGIFVMGATGESVKRVADTGFNPTWSPDGEFLAFSTISVNSPNRVQETAGLRVVRVGTGEVRTIDVKGDTVQPNWSRHGHRIAFWSDSLSGGNYRDIWTVSANGGEVVPATRDEHVDWNPVWSPDGEYVYFSSNRGGTYSLWRVSINEETGITSAEPEMVTASEAARIGQITVSSDARHIAYQANLSVMNLDKISFDPESEAVIGEPVPIVTGSRDVLYPDASPDGRSIAFSLFFQGGQADLAVIGADGSGFRQLTDEPQFLNMWPHWSPDGSEIVFYSSRSGNIELWSIHADGSGLRQLTEMHSRVANAYWSPDGKTIVFWSAGENYLFRPALPWKEQSAARLPRPQDGRFDDVSWSPDGTQLAGVMLSSGAARITLFPFATREYRVLPVHGRYPRWLSDGRRILFTNGEELLLLDVETGRVKEILERAGSALFDESLAISRDDRWIYYRVARREADIWMVTLDEKR
jgi:eukaryotic-like serine/threonine-protein kinase